MLYTLLLNSTYEVIGFISERKCFKHLAKDKVEILDYWDSKVHHGRTGQFQHPAVIRLKYQVRWIPRKVKYNYLGVFRRDSYVCQYCRLALTPSQATIDHVKPKADGGDNSWKNCVTACFECNNKKGNRTPEQAGMKLIAKPTVPEQSTLSEFRLMKNPHSKWGYYLGLE